MLGNLIQHTSHSITQDYSWYLVDGDTQTKKASSRLDRTEEKLSCDGKQHPIWRVWVCRSTISLKTNNCETNIITTREKKNIWIFRINPPFFYCTLIVAHNRDLKLFYTHEVFLKTAEENNGFCAIQMTIYLNTVVDCEVPGCFLLNQATGPPCRENTSLEVDRRLGHRRSFRFCIADASTLPPPPNQIP